MAEWKEENGILDIGRMCQRAIPSEEDLSTLEYEFINFSVNEFLELFEVRHGTVTPTMTDTTSGAC